MLKNIFRITIFLLLSAAAFVAITPIFSVNGLIYPIRIDSAYVSQQQFIVQKNSIEKHTIPVEKFLYSPSQLNINYVDLELPMEDSVILRGWLAIDTTRMQSPLLFIIPDITEGAVNYITAMKQFCDRGFNVCVMNMRAQGNSGGAFYTPGVQASRDVIYITNEIRKMPFIDRVVIMGNRTGAGIVLKAINDSSFADVVILQNPLTSFRSFFRTHAIDKWGAIAEPLMPAIIRSYESKTNIDLDQYDYKKMIRGLNVPQLLVSANFASKKIVDETLAMYNVSGYANKQILIDANSFAVKSGTENDKSYYDKISAFINSSLPAKMKKSRFKKFADK